MRWLSLLLWVGQFGFSVLFPTVALVWGAVWLKDRFGLGLWVVILGLLLGVLTSLATARSCLAALRKEAEAAGSQEPPHVSFNQHQ